MKNAPTIVESRSEAPTVELSAVLAKLARDHAHDVIAESSKLASAVRMGRYLAHTDLFKTAAPAGEALAMAGKAMGRILPTAEREAGQLARAGTHFAPAAAVSHAGAMSGEAQQLLSMAQKLEGAGHGTTSDISFLRNRAQQLMEGKALQGQAGHQEIMSAFENRLGELGKKSIPQTAVPKTSLSPPGARSLPPSPGQAPVGGATAAMHDPEAMYAGTMAKPQTSAVGHVDPTAMNTAQLEATPVVAGKSELRTGVAEPKTMNLPPSSAAPTATTGAAPVAPQAVGGLSTRDLAIGGVGVGGIGFGGGAIASRGHQQPQGTMPPLPPGYPQMTVTASVMPSLVTILKEAGMFANMGEAVAGWGAKAMKGLKAPAVEAVEQTGKKGMGWGTPLKVMGIGAGIGTAGAGIGAGALGVSHAVNQHRQFGTTAYRPGGQQSFMYPSQM